ncbi:MAG: DNA-binding protein WhiA [Erysipelotrichaceae bacterium]
MSFASDVKDEISRVQLDDNQTRARLSGVIQALASLSISNKGLSLVLNSTNANVSKAVALDLKRLYDVRSEFVVSKQTKLDKRNVYSMVIDEKVKEILNDLDLWTDKGLLDHPRMMFLANDEMVKAYLAGLFLAGGSVNSPSSSNYHLEIKVNSEKHGLFAIKLLDKFNIVAKLNCRRNYYYIYVKSSEMIADFLILVGAFQSLLYFEDVRIQRDLNNSITRLNNIDIANEQKVQTLCEKQIKTILFLKENDLYKLLGEKEKEVAQLRLDYPEESLSSLADLYQQRYGSMITKSGIRHRFDKISELADKYGKED